MAAFAICYRTPNKDQSIPQNNRNVPRCITVGRDSSHKIATKLCVRCSSESSKSIEKQLSSLDSYFGKLKHNTKLHTSDTSNEVMKVHQRNGQFGSTDRLESLDEYLGKLNNGINQESRVASYVENRKDESLVPKQILIQDTQRSNFRKPNTYVNLRRIKGVNGSISAIDSQQLNETSSLYLIGILASVNIAVFLFEIASPIRNDNLELFSLPLLYGAKINDLIMVGEWWRLITPMFLVQD